LHPASRCPVIGAEEVIVSSTGADYVFDPNYQLMPLKLVMEAFGCEECRILLGEAARAIRAHAEALTAFGDAARRNAKTDTLAQMRSAVRTTSIARETATERYENHMSAHELKTMKAEVPSAER
jgi:hypothetical protein